MSGSDMIICWTDSAGAAKCEDYVGTSSSANKIASQVTSLSAAGTKATALSADFSPYKTLFEWKFTVSTSSHVANFSAGTSALMTCYGFNFLGSSSSKHVNYYRISSSKDGDAAGNRPAAATTTMTNTNTGTTTNTNTGTTTNTNTGTTTNTNTGTTTNTNTKTKTTNTASTNTNTKTKTTSTNTNTSPSSTKKKIYSYSYSCIYNNSNSHFYTNKNSI